METKKQVGFAVADCPQGKRPRRTRIRPCSNVVHNVQHGSEGFSGHTAGAFSHRVRSRSPSSRPESLFSLPISQHRPRVTGVLCGSKALSALLFLHRQDLGCDVGDLEGVIRARRSGGGSGPSPGNEVEEQEDGRTGVATASAAHLTAGRAFLYCPDIHQTRCRAGGSIALSAGDGGLVSRRRFVDTQTAGCCPGGVMRTGYWLLGGEEF